MRQRQSYRGLLMSIGITGVWNHSSEAIQAVAVSSHVTVAFALVIDGAAHGHREKAEGIESSPKEEGCEGPSLRRSCVWVVERKCLVSGTLGKK